MAIRAGQIIRALDFAGYAKVWDGTNETGFNSITYTAGTTPVGLTFVAPTSGAVLVHWHARINLNSATGDEILVAVEVREGATLGSGTIIAAAEDDLALEIGQATDSRLQGSMVRDVTGLTPGDTYNARLLYKNAVSVASAGSIFARSIYTVPMHI